LEVLLTGEAMVLYKIIIVAGDRRMQARVIMVVIIKVVSYESKEMINS
jgi:hypothetical protein